VMRCNSHEGEGKKGTPPGERNGVQRKNPPNIGGILLGRGRKRAETLKEVARSGEKREKNPKNRKFYAPIDRRNPKGRELM